MNKKLERKIISDNKIIELYGTGWSINDIVAHYKASVQRVRRVLHTEGIETSKYRHATVGLKQCVLAMVAAGISLRRISETVDISTHLIRQVLRENQLTAEALRSSQPFLSKPSFKATKWSMFHELYSAGNLGFMKCAEMCGFSIHDCVAAVLQLSEEEVYRHRQKLSVYILSQKRTGLSAASIAKKLGVSTAIVKNIFNQTNYT